MQSRLWTHLQAVTPAYKQFPWIHEAPAGCCYALDDRAAVATGFLSAPCLPRLAARTQDTQTDRQTDPQTCTRLLTQGRHN